MYVLAKVKENFDFLITITKKSISLLALMEEYVNKLYSLKKGGGGVLRLYQENRISRTNVPKSSTFLSISYLQG